MGSGVPPIQVGDWSVADPVAVVLHYCRRYAATLHRYDWLAGSTGTLSGDLVGATRRVNSRISRREQRWLLDRAATAPWDSVDPAALLRDADPFACGGLYDAAEQLYQHFAGDRPSGVNHAKISKCLYLMRPGLVPILDSRLVARYRRAARTAARTLVVGCPDRPSVRRAYWAAVRNDLLRATDSVAMVRDRMRGSSHRAVVEAANRLSDVRVLDILAWSTGGPGPAAVGDHRHARRKDCR